MFTAPGNDVSYVSRMTDDVDCSRSSLSSSFVWSCFVKPRMASIVKSLYSRGIPASSYSARFTGHLLSHSGTVPPAQSRGLKAENSVDTTGHRRTQPPAESWSPPAENSVETIGRRTISGTGSGSKSGTKSETESGGGTGNGTVSDGARWYNGDVITRTSPVFFTCYKIGCETIRAP